VLHITDLSGPGNTRRHLVRWVAGGLRALGDRIFAANDAEARWRGWEITRRRAGLARTYRDPRFNALAPCPRCRGSGEYDEEGACRLCDGTGRLNRSADAGPGGVR
jgi:hypothetical protein